MNYINVYNEFIEYCKNTSLEERLLKRNKNDKRLTEDLYFENHHIIPKSVGGSDEESNLLKLLPEEHLFIHKLRYKAFNERESMLAVRFILNGLKNKNQGSFKKIRLNLTKSILSGYAFIKQESKKFREEHGWQTKDGLERISKARKNTFPVKCVKSGEIIGSFDKNHPKILSGEWVHHTKGMHTYIDIRTNEKVYIPVNERKYYHKDVQNNEGKNNPRWSGITDEEIVDIHAEISILIGFVVSKPVLLEYASKKYNIKIPKNFSNCRFKDKSLFEQTKEKTNLEYPLYVRGKKREQQNKKLKEIYDKN